MVAPKRTLRASCDNCHKVKVRCVPTLAGECQRCQSLNARCIHSPPGRSGRAPNSKRVATSSKLNDNNGHNDITLDDDQSDPIRTQSCNSDGDEGEDSDCHTVQPLFTEIDFTLDPAILSDAQKFTDLGDPTLLSSWSSVYASATTLETPPNENLQHGWVLGEFHFLPETPEPGLRTPTSISASEFAVRDQPPSSDISTSMLSPTMPLLQSKCGKNESCSCFRYIVRSLEKVQQTNVRAQGLDIVLTHNKESLINICNSLQCSSPHDGTTRLLILILLRKSLHLYHLLYRSRLKSTWNFPPCISTDTFVSSLQPESGPPELVQESQDGQERRLTLGNYQMDAADESSLKKQILILDMGKVPRLLERLDRRASGLDEGDGLDLYNLMRGSLIRDFQSMMTEVQT
ncbi:hypothetical protein V492_04597 [Pseudogymnoascus sp. VKM F-4246]|nr:hypothetical protein V492_04597 [Pseudogymnoascus sp. VKM F-4246]